LLRFLVLGGPAAPLFLFKLLLRRFSSPPVARLLRCGRVLSSLGFTRQSMLDSPVFHSERPEYLTALYTHVTHTRWWGLAEPRRTLFGLYGLGRLRFTEISALPFFCVEQPLQQPRPHCLCTGARLGTLSRLVFAGCDACLCAGCRVRPCGASL
jgi:hypothetical protein